MDHVEKQVTIINPLGLHARAAAQLVKLTSRFRSEIVLQYEGDEVNAKSIMGVLMLAAGMDCELVIVCDGDDAEAALDAVVKLFEAGFYEI